MGARIEKGNMTNMLAPQPEGFRRRRRPRGESFGSCLLMIVIVLGGGMWAYFKFGQNRHLVHAGEKGQYTETNELHVEANLNYMRKMREHHIPQTVKLRNEMQAFYTSAVKGKYKGNKEGFEQKKYELVQFMRDDITELNQFAVYSHFQVAHRSIAVAHKHFYDAILHLEKWYYAEPGSQDAKDALKAANEAFNKGWRFNTQGEMQMRGALETYRAN